MCNLSMMSGGTSDSDDSSKEMNDKITKEPLMKMVKCTTEHIIWDVETGSPIVTKYRFKTFDTELYQTQV